MLSESPEAASSVDATIPPPPPPPPPSKGACDEDDAERPASLSALLAPDEEDEEGGALSLCAEGAASSAPSPLDEEEEAASGPGRAVTCTPQSRSCPAGISVASAGGRWYHSSRAPLPFRRGPMDGLVDVFEVLMIEGWIGQLMGER